MTALRVSALIFVLLIPAALHAQRISIDAGAGAGIPLEKPVPNPEPPFAFTGFIISSSVNVERPHYVVGPVVHIGLGRQFSIEADGLYRPARFQTSARSVIGLIQTQTVTLHSTELPVLGQFSFGSGKLRPTAGVGFVVYHKLWGAEDEVTINTSTNQQTHVP